VSEEVVIDLTNISLKPIGKKEISQLEMALIIGTLYRPEILELIRDPIERATWIDSLAVAAAAFARYKAGIPVSQIAEELGRSEATVRSHLNQKTKAGKLVAETYEKIKRGELKLAVPFIKAVAASAEEEVRVLRSEVERLRERNRVLESQISDLRRELEKLRNQLNAKESETMSIKDEMERLIKERDDMRKKIEEIISEVKQAKEVILEGLKIIDRVTTAS